MTPRQKLEDGFRGLHRTILGDTTRELDIEGALSSGKTTLCLYLIRRYLADYPGISVFICRYSGTDTDNKLKPAFEQMCTLFDPDDLPAWDNKELCYVFDNGSKCYAFGLQAVGLISRYSKLRGLGVSIIYNDQTEELPADIALELRARIRRSLTDPVDEQTFSKFPKQIIFSPNPPNVDHYLAKQFPDDPKKRIAGRKLYQVSIYDNAHNLPPETIVSMETAYPPEHAKYNSVILGKRGPNVMGDPVYGKAFQRKLHVRAVKFNDLEPLLESFEYGKKHPCWVVAQQLYTGGLIFHGGIIGQEMFLRDFLPIVTKYRNEWFPHLKELDPSQLMRTVKTCATMSQSLVAGKNRFTGLSIIRKAGFAPRWRDNTNSPDVVHALIERLAGYMRERNASGEESLAVSNDPTRWLRASTDGIEPCPFIDQAFEAGYVWDEGAVSVANNEVRQPKSDDWFEHGMRCCEAIELHFCADMPSPAEMAKRAADARRRQVAGQSDSSGGGGGPQSWMGR